jgi:hypothetical protein
MAQPGIMVLPAMTPPTPTMASATCTEPLQRTAWRWSWCRCGCHFLCPCLSSQTLKRLLALPLEDAGAWLCLAVAPPPFPLCLVVTPTLFFCVWCGGLYNPLSNPPPVLGFNKLVTVDFAAVTSAPRLAVLDISDNKVWCWVQGGAGPLTNRLLVWGD